MKINPLYDRLVIRRKEESNVTEGGLYIPTNSKEKPAEGEVLATGTGRLLPDGNVRALTVKVGDRVLFSKYSGTEIKIDNQDYLIVREDDVLAVI